MKLVATRHPPEASEGEPHLDSILELALNERSARDPIGTQGSVVMPSNFVKVFAASKNGTIAYNG